MYNKAAGVVFIIEIKKRKKKVRVEGNFKNWPQNILPHVLARIYEKGMSTAIAIEQRNLPEEIREDFFQ